MAAVIWSNRSLADLESIYDYIARDSPLYARHQVEKIYNSAERLSQFPESGRRLPEFPNLSHKEIIIESYRLIYRFNPKKDEVKMITVVHGKRLLKTPV